MFSRQHRFDYSIRAKRRQKLQVAGGIALIIVVVAGIVFFSGGREQDNYNQRDIARLWREGAYLSVFEFSEKELQKDPMDFFLLMVHGFSAYQIAVAQINAFERLSYIDRSIWALRKAQLTKQGEHDARIKYALGRAYHYKGAEYAELCIQYLEDARLADYKAEDIPQFLGLSYAQVHDWERSIAAFSEALNSETENGPSDLLLLAISRSYIEMKDRASAKPYIMRAIELSKDWSTISKARLLLAGALMDDGDFNGAEAQIRTVLSEGGENAEAHFRLGVLYEMRNDYYRARAEWRRAFNLDPDYIPVREKLNL
ncbi:MAG: tetratricopeptide repeat protein [Spirochaetaceae bacterium]|jgi:tetratricopeptide (TPR) repeat protein|nr:tetratricopeptide repeat protein [Spirochaetaceae bacterium]GMO15611.1 MAG: tetratricopeptide repeat protein [Termitinemataceae bacterium]